MTIFALKSEPDRYGHRAADDHGRLRHHRLINIALAVAYEGYFLSTRGATLGKQVLGLKVIRSDGSGIPLDLRSGAISRSG